MHSSSSHPSHASPSHPVHAKAHVLGSIDAPKTRELPLDREGLGESHWDRPRKTYLPSAPAPAPPSSLREKAKEGGASLVLMATLGLAVKGVWARLAYAEGLDVSGVLFYRSAMSAPLIVMSTWFLLRKELRETGPAPKRSPRDYLPGAVLGALFSVGMFADFEAIAQLGASVSRVVLFGFPLVVIALNALKDRHLPPARQLFGFFVAWLGLTCVAQRGSVEPVSFGTFGGAPMFWGLASMTIYALYVFFSGNLSKSLGSVRLTSVSNLATAAVVVSVVLALGEGRLPEASTTALLWVAIMVVVSTVVPYFLMMEGIARLGSSHASLLAMTGPVVTVVAGWLFLGETLSALQLVGTLGVLAGVGVGRR